MGRPVELGPEESRLELKAAAFRMPFARRSSATSRFSRRTCSDSSLVVPGRAPPSTSARRTHLRTVSGVPTPSSCDTRVIAAHSDS
jgi:hypothetical protein